MKVPTLNLAATSSAGTGDGTDTPKSPTKKPLSKQEISGLAALAAQGWGGTPLSNRESWKGPRSGSATKISAPIVEEDSVPMIKVTDTSSFDDAIKNKPPDFGSTVDTSKTKVIEALDTNKIRAPDKDQQGKVFVSCKDLLNEKLLMGIVDKVAMAQSTRLEVLQNTIKDITGEY